MAGIALILLDLFKVIDFTKGSGFLFSAFILPHLLLLLGQWYFCAKEELQIGGFIACVVTAIICYLYYFWRLHILPFRENQCGKKRVAFVYGGRSLILFAFWALFFNTVLYLLFLPKIKETLGNVLHPTIFWADFVLSTLTLIGFLANGVIRVLCSSRQLGILRRALVLLFFWTPVINFWILPFLCKTAKEEYDFERCRFETRMERADSKICATKYPIIMVHGVGFRDLRWFNYWGRIPKELVQNGAEIYYGHQEAWAVLEKNAQIIKEKIEAVLKETGCEKVNIIAHSKGGLDSRYCISALGMADKVASLTTICTPHRGSELVPFLRKMPEGLFRLICNLVDDMFRAYGDETPDIYHSALQLTPEYCREFNEKYPNKEGVYYQSFTSVMKHGYGNSVLCIPYFFMKRCAGPNNDGLVEENSAKWGEFKGTFRAQGWRGVSHADMIDLQRKDYKGFDVIEVYVEIVKELKAMGF